MTTVLLIVFAPLVSGLIRKIKDNLRMRRGAGVWQPYYNFVKLLGKDQVVSKHASWIFTLTPVVVLACSVCACLLLTMGDLLVIFFILALGRFFLALAGLDAGSAFGGMGSSREVFISAFAEPAAFVAVFALAMNNGSTSAAALAEPHILRASTILAGCALFMVTLAETSRIPVDNQETHLELTMVHEAMVLEYSGRSLALIELAAHIKQLLFFVIIARCLFPVLGSAGWQWLELPAKILIIAVVVAVIEVSLAKMRLFRVVDYLGFAFFIALLAVIGSGLGI